MPEHYDILVAGAGFAGSITALALHNLGFTVCLLEKDTHPRFAIGESSTPVADMILRDLSKKYNLPWLHDFSRYGSWQQSHPEIICGLKRGFSYFKHYPDREFTTDENHSNELLVAASISDTQSDTNWLRSDFDAFLAAKAQAAGITYHHRTVILSAQRNHHWTFQAQKSGSPLQIQASFLVDATGGPALLQNIANLPPDAGKFRTHSFGVFSHFNNVPRWTDILQSKGIPVADFPYDPDDSALHQVLDEGWIWMLRFNTGLISIGFALDGEEHRFDSMTAEETWNYMCRRYPSVEEMIRPATLAAQPGHIIRSGRLQRRLNRCFGDGWVALPHTCGFVDPLFSSGIAHSLSGMERIIAALQQHWGQETLLNQQLQNHETAVFEELTLTDMLVAGCYKTMKHFPLFNAWSMLYFAATIRYEQRRLRGEPPGFFLSADDPYVVRIVRQCFEQLVAILQKGAPDTKTTERFTQLIKESIEPLNTAGLLNPASRNMYRHTTAIL